MKKITTIGLFILLVIGLQFSALGQAGDATVKFKKHINNIVQKVEKADNPEQKRKILNESFDKMISAFNKVASMQSVSEKDKNAITELKASIIEKKNELNGLNGFTAVKDNRLNSFANFVQQDIEQADETITISVTVLLLIIIILLLL